VTSRPCRGYASVVGLEAARFAPSACNQQPWRFAVVRDQDLRRRIVEEGFLPGITMAWAIDAPVHVVIGMERPLVPHRRLFTRHAVHRF
jgi:nitroreductase